MNNNRRKGTVPPVAKQAYFSKRLRGCGYTVDRMFGGFSKTDPREWMVILNPGEASLYCTCYINHGEADGVQSKSECYFEISDGGQFIPGRILTIDTNSIEVFVTWLVKYGIKPMHEVTNVQ